MKGAPLRWQALQAWHLGAMFTSWEMEWSAGIKDRSEMPVPQARICPRMSSPKKEPLIRVSRVRIQNGPLFWIRTMSTT
jgi:hypothetical protein